MSTWGGHALPARPNLNVGPEGDGRNGDVQSDDQNATISPAPCASGTSALVRRGANRRSTAPRQNRAPVACHNSTSVESSDAPLSRHSRQRSEPTNLGARSIAAPQARQNGKAWSSVSRASPENVSTLLSLAVASVQRAGL